MPRPSGRFSPAARVRKQAEYQEILRVARRVNTPRFALLLRARADDRGARLGLIVSSKVGGAVVRNRVKRLIRAAFRHTPELWPADIDVVVIAKRSTGDTQLDSVIDELRAVAGVLGRRASDARADLSRRTLAGSPGEKARDSRGP
ncbi:MAG: ribonuclease P protein component [Polyangiaceae bacterium]|nr:ribonuclease P protein component [Polyangiaceae bacterium]